ncbi:hypothetical protein F4678DRAFT_429959 [Xylaria arbuscula]|nr:hypothetical protein F4678DRAFT_429959 [Xylaria arbuscula]
MFVIVFIFSLLLACCVASWIRTRQQTTTRSPSGLPGGSNSGAIGNGAQISNDLDDIYPVHFLPNIWPARSLLMSYTFRYDSVLDAQKLHDSLALLLESGDWRKLTGRLRRNKNRRFEIHVPKRFSSDRPPFRFSHIKFNMIMEAHPLANRLPKKTGNRPSIQDSCELFRDFSYPSTLPHEMKHYLSTDEPMICLHINSFTDGTLVSFISPHIADVMGISGLLQAWTHAFREQSIDSLGLELEGPTQDVVASVGTDDDMIAKNTKFVLEDRQTTWIPLIMFLVNFVFHALTQRAESHHIYLPASFLTGLRNQAIREWELTQQNQNQPMPFISDGDLITAWGSRMVLSSAKWKGSALINSFVDMRDRIDILKSSSTSCPIVYLQNLVLTSTTLLTPEEARNLTISQIASRVRQAVVDQTSNAQLRSLMRLTRDWFSRIGTMPLFVSWNTTTLILVTNWNRARLLERADFGEPVATDTKTPPCGRSLRPVAYWGTVSPVTDSWSNTFVIYEKDYDGDYWVHAHLQKETWKLIQSELDSFTEK